MFIYRISTVPITEALQHLRSVAKHTLTAALICRGRISYPHFGRGQDGDEMPHLRSRRVAMEEWRITSYSSVPFLGVSLR